MRSKIGRARQVGETEINFLTSFHLRFRRAVEEMKGHPVDATLDEAVPPSWTDDTGDRAESEPGVQASVSADPGSPPTPQPRFPPGNPRSTRRSAESGRPPQRMASATAETKTEPDTEVKTDNGDLEVTAAAEDADDDQPKPRETPAATVKRAMETNNDQAVLREVYREVTGIAEVIWTTEEIPTTSIWDRVSTNPWYEASFSRLELRPLSDFYELISQVRAKRKAGFSKAQIQSFLNDSKFATTLLALRDMFQKVQI